MFLSGVNVFLFLMLCDLFYIFVNVELVCFCLFSCFVICFCNVGNGGGVGLRVCK